MCKEICRRASSRDNFFKRLLQDQQAKKVLELARKSVSLDVLDEIPVMTKISMPPRREAGNYKKSNQENYFSWPKHIVGDIIFTNG